MAATGSGERLADLCTHTLSRALGIRDRALVRVLSSFGLDATCAPLVTWIPAIELGWHRGLTDRERQRVLRLVYERHGILGSRAEVLLHEWLSRRPSDALFCTARRVLRAQLATLPADERPARCARVIAPCLELAESSRGLLGFAPVSDDQQHWLRTLAEDLLFPNEHADPKWSLS